MLDSDGFSYITCVFGGGDSGAIGILRFAMLCLHTFGCESGDKINLKADSTPRKTRQEKLRGKMLTDVWNLQSLRRLRACPLLSLSLGPLINDTLPTLLIEAEKILSRQPFYCRRPYFALRITKWAISFYESQRTTHFF